jgi:hypothetical protein
LEDVGLDVPWRDVDDAHAVLALRLPERLAHGADAVLARRVGDRRRAGLAVRE